MASRRRSTKKKNVGADLTENLLDLTASLRTAPCVPALREAVRAWRAGGYKGTTDTTRALLAHWFECDHRLRDGSPFRYHEAQRVAIETLIFVWEFEKVRARTNLLERYASDVQGAPVFDDVFARYAVKMATGSGKTKVMALAIAWQFLNAQREDEQIAQHYARTFLVIAPNVIVFERLRTDLGVGRIFESDPVIPRPMKTFWAFDCVMRGEGEKAHSEGALFLTNIDQLYDDDEDIAEPDPMTAVLGPKPPTKKLDISDFRERIGLRDGLLMVLNDEAHHTHDETNEWNKVIRSFHERTPVNMQVDFSATPRLRNGTLFPWILSDYPLKQAILDGIVKRPMRGLTQFQEAKSDHASVRYEGYLVAGVERWKEYTEQLKPTGKKPILFVMLSDIPDADDVADWLRRKFPNELGGEKTLVIHTNAKGEIRPKELQAAREAARKVDSDQSEVGAIVSVLMLREGWDVQNVTVIVGLRPFTARANILPEQAIGRGLRLMFRDQKIGYQERVDIIGNDKFLEFVDELERIEEIKFDTFDPKKDKLDILSIVSVSSRSEFDLAIPALAPVLVRKRTVAEEIAALDVMAFPLPEIKVRLADIDPRKFKYEGFDVVTDVKELERQYTIPEHQTVQEVIGFYARRIAQDVKLPSQFAALAPKVREFFEQRFMLPEGASMEDPKVVRYFAAPFIHMLTIRVFGNALRPLTIAEVEPSLLAPARALSTCLPFPWTQKVYEAKHTVFNFVACDNAYEEKFARFLDHAADVASFAKLAMRFGFSVEYLDDVGNLRLYHPDWVARTTDGAMYLLETKGYVGAEVVHKDRAARVWCENATALTGTPWTYRRVDQKDFEKNAPQYLSDLAALFA